MDGEVKEEEEEAEEADEAAATGAEDDGDATPDEEAAAVPTAASLVPNARFCVCVIQQHGCAAPANLERGAHASGVCSWRAALCHALRPPVSLRPLLRLTTACHILQ
jgi:hypothetical protein